MRRIAEFIKVEIKEGADYIFMEYMVPLLSGIVGAYIGLFIYHLVHGR